MDTSHLCVVLLWVCVWQGARTLPTVLTTWPYPEATDIAFEALEAGASHVEAVVAGCDFCDMNPDLCRNSVGPGRPNEQGETTLDALIMDGITHDAGAVGCLKRVQKATEVAYAVMKYTTHTLLVGEDATQFALEMGFNETSLETPESIQDYNDWLAGNCQPNHWQNVSPDPSQSCGPYAPLPVGEAVPASPQYRLHGILDPDDHDTIGMVAVDALSNVAAGASTNGLRWKLAGRVGDSPIPGAGAYADNDIGGAAATGNGDVMIRYAPSFVAVHYMGQGHSPSDAARMAIEPIAEKFPSFFGAVIALSNTGDYGAACYGYIDWTFTIREASDKDPRLETISCFTQP